eukprot:3665239-Pyramimonas_sp.AAC.1
MTWHAKCCAGVARLTRDQGRDIRAVKMPQLEFVASMFSKLRGGGAHRDRDCFSSMCPACAQIFPPRGQGGE